MYDYFTRGNLVYYIFNDVHFKCDKKDFCGLHKIAISAREYYLAWQEA